MSVKIDSMMFEDNSTKLIRLVNERLGEPGLFTVRLQHSFQHMADVLNIRHKHSGYTVTAMVDDLSVVLGTPYLLANIVDAAVDKMEYQLIMNGHGTQWEGNAHPQWPDVRSLLDIAGFEIFLSGRAGRAPRVYIWDAKIKLLHDLSESMLRAPFDIWQAYLSGLIARRSDSGDKTSG